MKSFLAILCLAAFHLVPSSQGADYPTKLDLQTSRTNPYTLIGQLFFASGYSDYLGSGVVIGPNAVLTAGHNLYDRDTGWSTDLELRRGAYGSEVLSEQYASRVYLLSGYRARADFFGGDDEHTFAVDMGGLRFAKPVAGGAYAGWTTDKTLLTSSSRQKTIVGYGAEGTHSGDYPLTVSTWRPFEQVRGAFLEAYGVDFEGGMSGGPVFAKDASGKLIVTGIVVSSSTGGSAAGGIRALNTKAANLIQQYLK
jgi:V8-like Glu-specific endopeptidase